MNTLHPAVSDEWLLFGNWRTKNQHITHDELTYIIMPRTSDIVLIDTEDLWKVKNCTWSVNTAGYCITNVSKHIVPMHMLIQGWHETLVIDHINGHKLDNRKANLRYLTTYENMRHGYKEKISPAIREYIGG